MTAIAHAAPLASSTLITDSLTDLLASANPGYSLTLCQRQPMAAITNEINVLSSDAFPDVRTALHAGKARDVLAELIESRGLDAAASFPNWLLDMSTLAEAFIAHVDNKPVTARLETLATVGCPRFHVDHSYLRLVCTYRGPGTEWLEDAQVDRQAQASGAPNDAIIRFGQPQRMPTFAIGLMKGRRYPGHEQAGLVHRSPLPDPLDPARVLFCLEC